MKKILLTSTGFDNKNLEKIFLDNLVKPVHDTKVVFVPTAANDEESKSVIPFCIQDLTNAGIEESNIMTYDCDHVLSLETLMTFDAIYVCGGSETYLMEAMNKIGFTSVLKEAIFQGLFYIGVSAGSMILTTSVENSLGIIPNPLEPHCEEDITPCGSIPEAGKPINISDNQAVWISDETSLIIE